MLQHLIRLFAAAVPISGAIVTSTAQTQDVENVQARETLSFSRGDVKLPVGGHLQGVQLRRDAAGKRELGFLSHDSLTVAYLLVVEFADEAPDHGRILHVLTFPSDGRSPPLRHAGGIQLLGDVLVVGLEDNQQKERSEVQFWNVADPKQPRQLTHLTVRRSGEPKDKTAGAVGLVAEGNRHLLAVANWDSRAVDLYVSNEKPLADADCRFELLARWRDDVADKMNWQPDNTFASYQAINLFAGQDGAIQLLGFATTPIGKDVADLYVLDPRQPAEKLLRKVARQSLKFDGDAHFIDAAGLWFDNGGLVLLATPQKRRRVDGYPTGPLADFASMAVAASANNSISSTSIVCVSSMAIVGRPNVQPLVSPGLISSRPASSRRMIGLCVWP